MNDAEAIRRVQECIAILRPIAQKHPECSVAKSGLGLMAQLEATMPPPTHWLYDDEVVLSDEALRLIERGVRRAREQAQWHTGPKGVRVLALCKSLAAFVDSRPTPLPMECLE